SRVVGVTVLTLHTAERRHELVTMPERRQQRPDVLLCPGDVFSDAVPCFVVEQAASRCWRRPVERGRVEVDVVALPPRGEPPRGAWGHLEARDLPGGEVRFGPVPRFRLLPVSDA